jgi:Fe-S oxidoreductase
MSSATPTAIAPFDKQGELPDAARVENAMRSFVADFGATAAAHMSACVRCGLCAEACHFYLQTGEAKYTPIHKLKPFEQAYAREVGPFAPIVRWLGLSRKVTIDDLQEWESLIYDSCTLCGRCTLICPMGIDIAELVKDARHGMYKAGLLPARLATIARNAETRHSPFGTRDDFIRTIREIEAKYGVTLPLDKLKADILVTTAPGELEEDQKSLVGIAKILDSIGAAWTFSSDAFEATNFGFLSGNMALQRELTMRIIDKAAEIGATTLLLPECGHAYSAARWDSAGWYDGPPPVRVLHMVEFLAELLDTGRIEVGKVGATATYHDPCQMVRRGGLEAAPRRILAALGYDLHEMPDHGSFGYCCGGGGGVLANARAEPLRLRVFELKKRQVEATGAEHFITSCGQCRLTFEKGAKAFHWDKHPESLLELVADNLIVGEKRS